MCIHCRQPAPNRRRFLSLAAAGTAASMFLGAGRAFAAEEGAGVSANDALGKLKAGNAEYVKAPDACAINLAKLAEQRKQVAPKQKPWATILTCADSRVPPELLFGGLGLGELFVARNAGNMADTATMGSIEYGSEHLGVRLVVVLGHERCGAVEAACDVVTKHATYPGSIGPMVAAIVPTARAVYRTRPVDFVEETVRVSAKRTAAKIGKSKIISHFNVTVVAARYDLDNGEVEFL
jgi:carbonic anhydrase